MQGSLLGLGACARVDSSQLPLRADFVVWGCGREALRLDPLDLL